MVESVLIFDTPMNFFCNEDIIVFGIFQSCSLISLGFVINVEYNNGVDLPLHVNCSKC